MPLWATMFSTACSANCVLNVSASYTVPNRLVAQHHIIVGFRPSVSMSSIRVLLFDKFTYWPQFVYRYVVAVRFYLPSIRRVNSSLLHKGCFVKVFFLWQETEYPTYGHVVFDPCEYVHVTLLFSV